MIPLLGALVHRFGRPDGRAAVLVRRWLWRGAALGANPAGSPPEVRRTIRAVGAASSAQDAARILLDGLPSAPRRWEPDLTQVRLNRALARVNLLGLVALEPRELLPAGTELPLPNPAIAPGQLLDAQADPLVRITPHRAAAPSTTTMADRILHPPISGDVVAALLAADDATRAGHAVDAACSELLAAGRWSEALGHRAAILRTTITDLVDERAEWGARDRPTAAELMGPISA